MTINEIIKESIEILNKHNIEYPRNIARILLSHVLGKDKMFLIINGDDKIKENDAKKYFEDINQIIEGKPLQYITGHQEFMKIDFYVDENVLIPRSDTEILVEEVIKIANSKKAGNILDICTGSGAIIVSVAKYIENIKCMAIDISEAAIEVAKKNAKSNEVDKRIKFIKSDMFNELQNEKFDIIVSNPPYIKRNIIKTLNKDVQKEPIIALDGGSDGLEFYKIIAKEAYKYLNSDGYLCLEIGYDQKEDVIELLNQNYKEIYSLKDYGNHDRVIVCKRR